MNMKTAYKVYLFCCVLFLTGLFLLVPVYAVEDMWTAASRIIKDIYMKTCCAVSWMGWTMILPP